MESIVILGSILEKKITPKPSDLKQQQSFVVTPGYCGQFRQNRAGMVSFCSVMSGALQDSLAKNI